MYQYVHLSMPCNNKSTIPDDRTINISRFASICTSNLGCYKWVGIIYFGMNTRPYLFSTDLRKILILVLIDISFDGIMYFRSAITWKSESLPGENNTRLRHIVVCSLDREWWTKFFVSLPPSWHSLLAWASVGFFIWWMYLVHIWCSKPDSLRVAPRFDWQNNAVVAGAKKELISTSDLVLRVYQHGMGLTTNRQKLHATLSYQVLFRVYNGPLDPTIQVYSKA